MWRGSNPAMFLRTGQANADHEITAEYSRRSLSQYTADDRWNPSARPRGRVADRSVERTDRGEGAESGAAGLLSTADGTDPELRYLHGEGQRRTGACMCDKGRCTNES